MTDSGENSSARGGKLLASRRAEAVALLDANHRGRSRASGVLALAVLTVVVAAFRELDRPRVRQLIAGAGRSRSRPKPVYDRPSDYRSGGAREGSAGQIGSAVARLQRAG
jgi:hypothetical protein